MESTTTITNPEGDFGLPTVALSAIPPRERGGQVGRLVVSAARVGGKTVLRSLHSEGTLKAMRVHYLDPALPAMAFLTIASPGGGVLQGDRLCVDISVEEGGQLHIGTTSATRIYAMPRGRAEAITRFTVGTGAYAEFVPDPFIPYAGSQFTGHAAHVVAEGGVLLVAEVVGPGRQARGERLAYDSFDSDAEVRRPNGRLLFRDTTRLRPPFPGLMGAWCAMGSLHVIASGLDASVFDSAMTRCEEMGLSAGCSELPNQAGRWFRVLAPDAAAAQDAVRLAWAAARTQILGFSPPISRRY
jgi:urease accessory protein